MRSIKIYLFLLVISALPLTSLSQSYQFELTNMNNGKTRAFSYAEKVKVITLDSRVIEGSLSIANDSTLMINNILIGVSEIETIKLKSAGTRIAGGVISGAGMAITGIGLLAVVGDLSSSDDDWDGCGVIFGGLIAGCGLIILIPGLLLHNTRMSYSARSYIFSISEM